MAVSYLVDAQCDVDTCDWLIGDRGAAMGVVRQMIDRGFNSPWTSSAGRLFDAVAALAGVHLTVSFDGQAASGLEALAMTIDSDERYELGRANRPPGGAKRAVSP